MKSTPAAITAVFSGNIDILKALTADNFKETDELGRTAIHAACYKGNTPMLEHMVAALGDKAREVCDKQDNDGVTAAHYCCGQEWKGEDNPHPLYATPVHAG